MSSVARCKFTVHEVALQTYGEHIKLQCEYDEKVSKEDQAFSDLTPSGIMEFHLRNNKLYGRFKPGQQYYVDLTPVSET